MCVCVCVSVCVCVCVSVSGSYTGPVSTIHTGYLHRSVACVIFFVTEKEETREQWEHKIYPGDKSLT